MAVNLVCEAILRGERVAYFGPTYKDNSEIWDDVKYRLLDITTRRSEQERRLSTETGGLLDMWSMDNPDSGRGRAYHLAIIDECEKAGKFQEAWEQAIRPTLTDYRGSAWLLSTPKFGKTYFKEVFRKAPEWADWASFKFTIYDNPHISKDEIDSIKKTFDSMVFRCEYMADDVDLSLNPFAYAFDKEKHVKPVELDPYEHIQLSFDFNVDPITCLAAQSHDTGQVNILSEFRLENSDIYAICERIRAKYPQGVFIVTGDATGRARSAITAGNINYYTVIKQELSLVDTQLKQPGVNPSVADTRVLVNSLLQNAEVNISPDCTYLIEDLIYCEVDDKGDIDKKQDKHKTHLLDCFRYLLNTFHRQFIKY